MRIAVCIKQVPVLSAMAFDPSTRTLKRDDVRSEISSFDVRALTKAIDLRSQHGGEVVAITMGPPQAREALLECLALGADRALHLCDRAFAGADTLATARALALVLKSEAFDLVLCGRYSVDAETAQVGPEIAELLAIPQISAARSLSIGPDGRTATVERETDEGTETVLAEIPVLVTATEDLAPERFPSKADRESAKAKLCIELSASQLADDVTIFGASGSPTWVDEVLPVESNRCARIIEGPSIDAAAGQLARLLIDEHQLFRSLRVGEQPAIASVLRQDQPDMSVDIWVVAETLHGTLRPVSFELLGKARELGQAFGGRVSCLLLGNAVKQHAPQLAAHGADRVLVAEADRLAPFNAETHAAVLADAIERERPYAVLFPGTGSGRDLAPRLAARLQLGLTGDCIDLGLDQRGRLVQYKPAFGGSIVAHILSHTTPAMATLRPGMLNRLPPDSSRPVRVTSREESS